jgi:hypothetical protein
MVLQDLQVFKVSKVTLVQPALLDQLEILVHLARQAPLELKELKVFLDLQALQVHKVFRVHKVIKVS